MLRKLHAILLPIARGGQRLCPKCGQGKIFSGWYSMRDRCDHCQFRFEPNPGDTWAFMYISTAFMTGLFVVLMFLVRPENLWAGRILVWAFGGMVIGGSLPRRKGIAIALEYVLRRSLEGESQDDQRMI